MHRRSYLFVMFCLTLVVIGCGDTPQIKLRDTITTWNEVLDTLYEIPDDPDTAEEVAGQLLKGKLKALKEKNDEVKKRLQLFQKADKDDLPAINQAILDLSDEAHYTLSRYSSLKRLANIIAKVRAAGQPTPNLEACATFFSQFSITLPSDQKKFPATQAVGNKWRMPGGAGQGGGGMPGMRGGGGPGMPGVGPGGRPGMPGQ